MPSGRDGAVGPEADQGRTEVERCRGVVRVLVVSAQSPSLCQAQSREPYQVRPLLLVPGLWRRSHLPSFADVEKVPRRSSLPAATAVW